MSKTHTGEREKLRALVSGAQGMLGRVLVPYLSAKGYAVKGFDLDEGDICNSAWLAQLFEAWRPDIFCNCAAYTKVDDAEEHQDIAFRVNGDALKGIVELCSEKGAVLVHISTDYVFDGKKRTPYEENDVPNPLSIYGKSKWEGERNILSYKGEYDRFYIIRTSWLYGHFGQNFVSTILDLGRKKEELEVVDDQKGTPTSCDDMAEAVYTLLSSGSFGIYHFSGEGSCSWYELARACIEMASKKGFDSKVKAIHPVTSERFKRPAPRPSFSVMDKSRYKEVTCKGIPHWLDSLEKFVSQAFSCAAREYSM